MSRIQSKNTAPERIVRTLFHKSGYRFRLHQANLPGTPDIVLPKYKTVVFVNGCFWHQHKGCKKATVPKSNVSYWIPKLNKNVKRLERNGIELKKLNWKVVVIWECETINPKKVLKNLESKIKK